MKSFAQLLMFAALAGGLVSAGRAAEKKPAGGPPITSFDEAVKWLQTKSFKMIRASRTPMPNGVAAFPPQAGVGYAAFWLRDYAYQLEGCVDAFSDKELTDACRVFTNALRADGAGVDCVKFTGQPIYMPGYGSMGANPVADGSQFTVDVAWCTYQKTKDDALLKEILDKLVKTMEAPPRDPANGLIYIKPGGWDRCPYGFTDSIRKQGDELFCSLLYIQACRQLGDLMEAGKRPDDAKKWRAEADKLVPRIRKTFWDEKTGLFLAATKLCNQPDIWGSAFAVYLDVASPEETKKIATYFKDHYSEIVQKGQIRHLPGGMYWHAGCGRNSYQNGGYWATPTGWFVYTLDLVDPKLADQTVIDMVNDFRERGVSEWVLGPHLAVMNYLASATMPLAGVRKMLARRGKPYPAVEMTSEPQIRKSDLRESAAVLPRPKWPINCRHLVTPEQEKFLQQQVASVLKAAALRLADGTTIYAPCGSFYRGLWPRDYEYVVEGAGTIVKAEDLRAVCKLLIAHQMPNGWAPITINPELTKFDYRNMGPAPESDSAQFFVKLCYQDFLRTMDLAFTGSALDDMKRAMDSTPREPHGLVWIDPKQWHTGYGFTDSVGKSGQELYSSLLYWECCRDIAAMASTTGREFLAADFTARAKLIEKNIDDLKDEKTGLYFAASGNCRQLDVWGNAYLVYIRFPDEARRQRISSYLAKHYDEYVQCGQVRHLFGKEHWQRIVAGTGQETYQDGGYWGTATGWAAYAIAQVDPPLASRMLGDMLDYYAKQGAYESINDKINYRRNRNYSASVTLPLAALRRLQMEPLGPLGAIYSSKGYAPERHENANRPDSPANLAYVGNGARPATATSTIDNPKHHAKSLNDGKYGNDSSWIPGKENASFQIQLAKKAAIGRFRLGRDREGAYDDRTLGSLKIEASADGQKWQTVYEGKDLGSMPGYDPRDSLDILTKPTEAAFVKVTVGDANCCIDEFEIYAPAKDAPEKLPAIRPSQNPLAAPMPRPMGNITPKNLVTDEQYNWLAEKMGRIIEAVRMKLADGTTIYSPGVYVGLWQRDCYYAVHGGAQFVPAEDIREIVRLTLKQQRADGIVPKNTGNGGSGYVCWGPPPECDSAQFVVLLTSEYYERSKDKDFVAANLKALVRAMDSMPRNPQGLIWIDPAHPHTGYGFTDQVFKTGAELYSSLLYWEASRKLAAMARAAGLTIVADDFQARAALIEKNLSSLWDEKTGMYFAASQDCRQTDIWGSAYAVYIGFPDKEKNQRISKYLAKNYDGIVYAGQVRHLPGGEYWKKTSQYIGKDQYQNGAYWGTASGWVAYAIAQVDPPLASKMLGDLIDYYRRYNAYECINPTGYRKYPGYAASVANPLAAIRELRADSTAAR